MDVSANNTALTVDSSSTARRRRRDETASDSIVGLSAIVAQFSAIYGVDNDGKDDGSASTDTKEDVASRVADSIADLTTIDASSRQWSGQGLNIIGTPRESQIYARYLLNYKTYVNSFLIT